MSIMIEEEKEAIKTLEEILKEWQKIIDIEDPIERECEMSCYMEDMPFYQIKILLKLVKKQQNKIDAQEMEHQYDQKMIDDLKGEMVHNWIHKDKIRKRIEEARKIRWHIPKLVIEYFEELLEEK